MMCCKGNGPVQVEEWVEAQCLDFIVPELEYELEYKLVKDKIEMEQDLEYI